MLKRHLRQAGKCAVKLLFLSVFLLLAGCRAGEVAGFSLSIGSYERGLWFDHDTRDYTPRGWGLKFDVVAGHMIRPVPKFWEKDTNPWKGDDPWFVIRFPMIGPYLSVSLGQGGAYLGLKTFRVEDRHRSLERYGKWMRENEFPDPNGANVYLQPSATIRRTRWK